MSHPHLCEGSGYMVAPDEWLPVDAFDYDWTVGGVVIGCNNLRCSKCEEPVRNRIDGAIRKYECRCDHNGVGYGGTSVAAPLDPLSEDRLPWACAGHPPLQLPAVLDGVPLAADSDWRALARQVFTHAIDPTPHPKAVALRGFWVQRLYNILDEKAASKIAHVVSELLLDAEPRVRGAAIAFYQTNSSAPGIEKVAQAFRDHPEQFVGVRDPDTQTMTLWSWMEGVLSLRMLSDADPLARQLLKDRAVTPPGLDRALYTFARSEPAWLSANAEAILNAAPERWSTVLYVLRGSPRHAELAREVVRRGYASDVEVQAEIAKPS